MVTIEQSDSDSEQSAQLVSILQKHKYGVPDYHILTAGHNETALGEKCLSSFLQSPQHASGGNGAELSGLNSMYNDGRMRTPDSHRSTTTSDSLSDGFGQRFDTVVSMTAIWGQDEVVALPNDQARIQTIMEG